MYQIPGKSPFEAAVGAVVSRARTGRIAVSQGKRSQRPVHRKLRRLYELIDKAVPDPLPGYKSAPSSLGALTSVAEALEHQSALHEPAVSVIISTLNRAAHLEATLHALLSQRYTRFEVVVVQGPCSDDTDRILDRWQSYTKRTFCEHANLSMSRNIGMRIASGDLFAFIDDDAIPEPDWLARLVEPFRDPRVGASGGAIRNWTGLRYQCRALKVDAGALVRRTTPEALASGVDCPAFTGTNFCVRRDLALAAGLFDEAYAYFLEESDLQLILFRAGARLVYVEHAEVHHLRAPNAYRAEDRVPSDYAAKLSSVSYFCLKHRSEGDDRHDLIVRIAWQLHFTINELGRHFRSGRLDLDGVNQRVRSAFHGMRRGTKIYGARLNCAVPSAPLASAPALLTFVSYGLARRVALICYGGNQDVGQPSAVSIAQALSNLHNEVTLVRAGSANTVAFRAGYWLHEKKRSVNQLRRGLTMQQALKELRRVDTNRQFDVVVCLNFRGRKAAVVLYPWQRLKDRGSRLALRAASTSSEIDLADPKPLVEQVILLLNNFGDRRPHAARVAAGKAKPQEFPPEVSASLPAS